MKTRGLRTAAMSGCPSRSLGSGRSLEFVFCAQTSLSIREVLAGFSSVFI